MEKISFCGDWFCRPLDAPSEQARPVTLPHDAMQWDAKKADSPSGVHNGWHDARDYVYEKRFFLPGEDRDKVLFLEFEGVYRNAEVLLNGAQAASHSYGYTGFYVPLNGSARWEEENLLQVYAHNSDQPNCRWYSGTGIYRPVWLCKLPRQHILLDGVRVTTLDIRRPKIRVEADTTDPGAVEVEVLDGEGHRLACLSGQAQAVGAGSAHLSLEIELPGAALWSPDAPNLHLCRIRFGADSREIPFGLRTVEWDCERGFCINGTRVILRGCCIHHDNGLLGARAYPFAEARKIRILRENGYNAIRSAHNPCSKALLEACDRMGMLVMDEYTDAWYIHKNRYDYAGQVEKNYPQDLANMVAKDYNHPSVVLYSTGNEVSETAQRRGVELCQAMTDCLHRLDSTRPVTCGVNIFFNFLSTLGFGVYSDKKARQEAEHPAKKKAVGSEFFNKLAGALGADFMKWGATLPPCDWTTRDAYAAMDMAGYNYGIRRYAHDLKKYPRRLILGTETFCADAARFWDMAQNNPRIIGDFVWAGMDYLGEVAIGSWEYADYAPDFSGGVGWVSAGSGRVDLTGHALGEAAYTKVAFGLEPVAVAVVPAGKAEEPHSPSAWKMSNGLESWSWNGQEGKQTRVEVYARAERVTLTLNGKEIASGRPGQDCRISFPVTYEPGDLRAAAYDIHGRLLGEKCLHTAGDETVLSLEPEQRAVPVSDGLCYVRLKYTDRQGELKPLARGDIRVEVENGRLLGLGSACPYYPRGYLGDTADTYYGQALAIVAPDGNGPVRVRGVSSYGQAETEIQVI